MPPAVVERARELRTLAALSSSQHALKGMAYSSGDEYLSVVLVGTATPPLWFYERWTAIARSLDQLIYQLGGRVGVRTTQAENGSQLRFGRLAWGEQSDRKWTHGSPETKHKSVRWSFIESEVWCPHWAECARSRMNPLFFVSMANPFLSGMAKRGQFNQLLISQCRKRSSARTSRPLLRPLP